MKSDVYETSDLALAAYLAMRGYSISNISYNNDGKATFEFVDDPNRSEHVLRFFNRKVKVEPIGYLGHVKSLKAMLKSN